MPKDSSIRKVLVIGSGPRDTAVLFDRFVENMVKGGKENA